VNARQMSLFFICLILMQTAALADDATKPVTEHLDVESAKLRPINADLDLSSKDLDKLVPAALGGDGDAALRLGSYYAIVKRDKKAQMYWYQVSAEDNDPNGWYDYGVLLSQSEDPKDKLRAHYWIDKAASAGIKEAKEFFQRQ